MNDLEFESGDLAETQDFLVKAYTPMRIRGDGPQSRARIVRRWVGPVNVDELEFSYTMSYDANPLRRIALCRVHAGHIEENFAGEPQGLLAPGDITLFVPPDLPHSGRVCRARYDLTMFDSVHLNRVAATAAGAGGRPVRLTGHRPVSAAAGRQLGAFIGYLREHVLSSSEARSSPLLVSTLADHLAATVLTTFPNTALADPTATDRRDSTPALLRRAMTYIDDHADADVALADIAAHTYVTPRALQYMFRRHLDMTPMQYLRKVRLERAHCDLQRGDPSLTTVKAVAARWGFSHTGRFASMYRRTYGRSPHHSLQN